MSHYHYPRAVGRWALAATLHYTGLLRLYRFFKRRVLGRDGVILCYHRVLPRANGHCDYSQRGIVTSNVRDGHCTGPLGRFSPALFAFALSGLREALLHRP